MRRYEKPEAELIKFTAMETIATGDGGSIGGTGSSVSSEFNEDDFEG